MDKKDIQEVRNYVRPPPLVMLTMDCVLMMIGEKSDWSTAKQILTDPKFLDRLLAFDKDAITDSKLKKLEKYIQKSEYQPDQVGKQSKACRSLCIWTHAMHTYSVIARDVGPKKLKLE